VPPVHAFLIFPSDKTELIDQNPEVGRIAHKAFENIRDWLARETGWTFELVFNVLRSAKTMKELGAYPNDPCGQGLDWGTVLAEMSNAVGGFGGQPERGRHLAVVINGGGWAGGSLTWHPDDSHFLDDYSKSVTVGTDIGRAVFGSWHFLFAATGKTDPCAVREYNEDFAKNDFTDGLGHECLHAFGVDSHNPTVGYPGHLTDPQKAQYLAHNGAFLFPVVRQGQHYGYTDPVEPTHPIPPVLTVKKYRIEGTLEGSAQEV